MKRDTEMTSKLDVLSAITTRLGYSRDSGKIKPENDYLIKIKVKHETENHFDIVVHMEKRASLIVHVIRLDGDVPLTTRTIVGFDWDHVDGSPAKPSHDAGEAPLCATFLYTDKISEDTIFGAARYLVDGWLDDTNPDHMWSKIKDEND